MKVLLYFEGAYEKVISRRKSELDAAGVEYTLNPNDSYDVLHIHSSFIGGFNVVKDARKKGASIIYSVLSVEEDFNKISAGLLRKRLLTLFVRADFIITETQKSKQLLENVGLKNIRVIPDDITPVDSGNLLKALYNEVYSDYVSAGMRLYINENMRPGKLNIGLFSDTYPPDVNGVSISVATLRKQLVDMGHNVYMIIPSLKTKLIGTEFNNGILSIPAIKLKQLYGYRLSRPYSPRALDYIKKMNLDIVHVHTEYSMRLYAKFVSAVYGIPFLCTYHTMYEDYTHYVTHGHLEKSSKKIVAWYTKQMLSERGELIVPSSKTKNVLEGYGIKKKIHIIPTGIDTTRFNPKNLDPEKLSNMKEKYGLTNHFCLCYVGRLAPEKSVDMIITALPLLIKTIPDFKLIITGYGPSEEALKKQTQALGISSYVIFTGKQPPDQIQYFYAVGDVFVSASTSETQGLTYIEAMGAGKPVIARYDDCLLDVLIEGKTGYFFKDIESLVNKIIYYHDLTDCEKQEIYKNVLLKADEYSLETFGNRMISVYNEAISKRKH